MINYNFIFSYNFEETLRRISNILKNGEKIPINVAMCNDTDHNVYAVICNDDNTAAFYSKQWNKWFGSLTHIEHDKGYYIISSNKSIVDINTSDNTYNSEFVYINQPFPELELKTMLYWDDRVNDYTLSLNDAYLIWVEKLLEKGIYDGKVNIVRPKKKKTVYKENKTINGMHYTNMNVEQEPKKPKKIYKKYPQDGKQGTRR